MSPKPKKPQKPKNGKKDELASIGSKRERKDSKTAAAKKDMLEATAKIDATKVKQLRVDTVNEKAKEILEAPKVKQSKEAIHFEIVKTKLETLKAKQRTEVAVENKVKTEIPKINKQPKIEATVNVETKKIKNINNWTRDEDKTMLQVLKGEAESEKVFGRIRELLPHRSETEIKDRFCHVMTLLQQMAVGEVT